MTRSPFIVMQFSGDLLRDDRQVQPSQQGQRARDRLHQGQQDPQDGPGQEVQDHARHAPERRPGCQFEP